MCPHSTYKGASWPHTHRQERVSRPMVWVGVERERKTSPARQRSCRPFRHATGRPRRCRLGGDRMSERPPRRRNGTRPVYSSGARLRSRTGSCKGRDWRALTETRNAFPRHAIPRVYRLHEPHRDTPPFQLLPHAPLHCRTASPSSHGCDAEESEADPQGETILEEETGVGCSARHVLLVILFRLRPAKERD